MPRLSTLFSAGVSQPKSSSRLRSTGARTAGSDCHDLCEKWRVDHTLAPVGRPTGNAVAKRFIQTLKVELIWTRDWASVAELREAVKQWLHVYNHVRPHQALSWMTPAEKRAENLGIEFNRAA